MILGVRVAELIKECAARLGIDLSVDPDEIHLRMASIVANTMRSPVYESAVAVINAMMLDDAARARYREIWGEEWTELPPMAGEEFDGLPARVLLERDSTAGSTIPSSPRARRS